MLTTSWLEEEASGSYGTNSMTMTTSVPLHITKFTIDVFPSTNTTNSRFTITISDDKGSTTYISETIVLPDNTSEIVERYVIPLDFTSAATSTITIKFTATNNAKTTRVASLTDAQKIVYGSGAKVTTTWAFPCAIEYELAEEPPWEIIEDFPTLVENEFVASYDFKRNAANVPINPYVWYISTIDDIPIFKSAKIMDSSFAKDKYGYPYNQNVWRIDDNNFGYAWITGYAQRPLSVNLTIGTEDGILCFKKKKGKIQFGKNYNY